MRNDSSLQRYSYNIMVVQDNQDSSVLYSSVRKGYGLGPSLVLTNSAVVRSSRTQHDAVGYHLGVSPIPQYIAGGKKVTVFPTLPRMDKGKVPTFEVLGSTLLAPSSSWLISRPKLWLCPSLCFWSSSLWESILEMSRSFL